MLRHDKTWWDQDTNKTCGMLNGQIVLSCFKMCHVTQSISWHQETLDALESWNPAAGSTVHIPSGGMSKKLRHATSWLNPLLCSLSRLSRPLKQGLFWVASQLHSSHQFLAPSIPVSTGHISTYVGTDVSLFLNMGVRLKKNHQRFAHEETDLKIDTFFEWSPPWNSVLT